MQPTTDFVLTADIDWASEYCIEHFLGIADRYSLKPTLFVTHESPAIRKAEREGRAELAIHPNFLAGSSHGASPDAVIDHVLKLVPDALAVRYHRYFGAPKTEDALVERGLRYDSNVCRHLQPGLLTEPLASGLLRFPVFFEDDVHWDRGLSWDFPTHAAAFFSPGLKVLNFHPFFVALNVPSASFYARQKQHITTLTAQQAAPLRHAGAGTETFLVMCLETILATGNRVRSLRDLVDDNPAWNPPSRPRVTYQSAD